LDAKLRLRVFLNFTHENLIYPGENIISTETFLVFNFLGENINISIYIYNYMRNIFGKATHPLYGFGDFATLLH
jgi:hypothetical protein